MKLYRPVGQKELDLIKESGYKEFPPRLEWQPIFYPVLYKEYARQIASEWNTEDEFSGYVGYVLEFEVNDDYIKQYDVQSAGGKQHKEYWIPAEKLTEFNSNIIGLIKVIEKHENPKRKEDIKMKKLLIVVDMQNDFITGALGSKQAQAIVPYVKAKIEQYKKEGHKVLLTRDTHFENYLSTQEGKNLPVPHCIKGTDGHLIAKELNAEGCEVFDKLSFGSIELAKRITELAKGCDEIELCGLCTDICVVSNALILKAQLPETKVVVDAKACAGVTDESHKAALLTMKMCQVEVRNV